MKWRTMSFHFRHKMKWSSQLHGWEGPQRSIAGDLLLEKKEDWFFFPYFYHVILLVWPNRSKQRRGRGLSCKQPPPKEHKHKSQNCPSFTVQVVSSNSTFRFLSWSNFKSSVHFAAIFRSSKQSFNASGRFFRAGPRKVDSSPLSNSRVISAKCWPFTMARDTTRASMAKSWEKSQNGSYGRMMS